MQKPPQPVAGAVSLVGPQPVQSPGSIQSGIETSSTLGSTTDAFASNPGGATMNAKLGAIMVSLAQLVEIAEYFMQRAIDKDEADADAVDR